MGRAEVITRSRKRDYLSVGVIFQMVDEARPEFPDIGFHLPDVLPQRVQFRQKDAVPIGAAILAPANYSPAHVNDQYSDGADCRKNLPG